MRSSLLTISLLVLLLSISAVSLDEKTYTYLSQNESAAIIFNDTGIIPAGSITTEFLNELILEAYIDYDYYFINKPVESELIWVYNDSEIHDVLFNSRVKGVKNYVPTVQGANNSAVGHITVETGKFNVSIDTVIIYNHKTNMVQLAIVELLNRQGQPQVIAEKPAPPRWNLTSPILDTSVLLDTSLFL